MMKVEFDQDEINTLIALLHTKGIHYLWGNDVPAQIDHEATEPVDLLQRLIACGYPIVENAIISLLILQPDFAPSVVEVLHTGTQDITEELAVITLATLYLQQWWLFRLTFALGHLPSFPEAPFENLWEERHLPPPSARYGMDGLLALQEYKQQKWGMRINFLSDWQNQINHLLAQEGACRRQLSEDLRQALIKMSTKEQVA